MSLVRLQNEEEWPQSALGACCPLTTRDGSLGDYTRTQLDRLKRYS